MMKTLRQLFKPNRAGESGNVFMTLFAAVAVVGVIGAGTVSIMNGPVSTMVSLNKQNMAELRMEIAAKLIIIDGMRNYVDDSDTGTNYLELTEYAAGSITGGGTIPSSLNINDIDPWGTQFGYCTWDNGDVDGGKDDTATGTDDRLQGQTTAEMTGAGQSADFIAVVSAGPNRAFETGCYAYDSSGNEGLTKAANSDDIVLVYRYDEAQSTMGDLWQYGTDSDETDAVLEIDQNLNLKSDVTFTGLLQFNIAGSGLVLPTTPGSSCDASQEDQLFLDTGATPPSIVICDSGSTSAVLGGGDGSGSGAGSTYPDGVFDINTVPIDSLTYVLMQASATIDTGLIAGSKKILRSSRHNCALKHDGLVYCWGEGSDGQLGNNASDDVAASDDAVQVYGLTNAIDIAAGYDYTCAVKDDGTAWCWGLGTSGELGDGNSASSSVPVQVSGVTNFKKIESQYDTSTATSSPMCGLTTSGSIYCWGRDTNGELGNDETLADTAAPEKVFGISDFVDFDLGLYHGCGVRKNGEIWCWGDNGSLQLGGSDATEVGTPIKVQSSVKFKRVAASALGNCGLSVDNAIYCWGEVNYGALGDGGAAGADQATPSLVDDADQDFVDIHAQGHAYCALKSDGRPFCWGRGARVGLSYSNVTSPTQVGSYDNVTGFSGTLDAVGSITMHARSTIDGAGDTPTSGYRISQAPSDGEAIESHGLEITWDSTTSGHEAGIGFAVDATSITGSDTYSAAITGQYRGASGTALAFRTQDSGGASANIKAAFDPEGNLGLHSGATANDALLVTGASDGIAWNTDYAYGLLVTDTDYATPQVGFFGIDETTGAAMLLFSKDFYVAWTNNDGTTLQTMAYFISGSPVQLYADLLAMQDDAVTITSEVYSDTAGDTPVLRFDRYGGTTSAPSDAGSTSTTGQIIFQGSDGSTFPTDGQAKISAENNASTIELKLSQDGSTYIDAMTVEDGGVTFGGTDAAGANLRVVGRGTSDDGLKIGTDSTCGSDDDGTLRFTGTDIEYCDGNDWQPFDNSQGNALNCEHGEQFIQFSGESSHTCGVFSNGRAACWGDNANGKLGFGTVGGPDVGKIRTISKAFLDDVKQIETGANYTCALLHNGAVKCWGTNNNDGFGGKLGRGHSTNADYPVPATIPFNEKFTQIDVEGQAGGCGVTESNRVACWGANSSGRIGNNTTTAQTLPVYAYNIGNAVRVQTTLNVTCALLKDGTVKCWGDNSTGEVGVGSTGGGPYSTPQDVGLTDVVDIAIGRNQTVCVLKNDGTVWCWGRNTYQQLGNGGANSGTPTAVSGVTDVVDITIGAGGVYALKDDGSIMVWGRDFAGELGEASPTIIAPKTMSGVTASMIAEGTYQSFCFLDQDGAPKCIGNGVNLTLGNDVVANSSTPVDVANPLACTADKYVFVASTLHDGDFDGIAGADAYCQYHADQENLPGTYYAWLSDLDSSPSTRFNKYHGIYYLPDDSTQIADDWTDLTDNTIDNAIDLNEDGTTSYTSTVWSNTTTAGALDAIDNCSAWNSADAGVDGNRGSASSATATWTDSSTNACNGTFPLYCFQQ